MYELDFEKQNKILTFRDFSHLSYIADSKVSRQKQIVEQKEVSQNVNIKDFALEILNEIVDVVVEDVEEYENELINFQSD